jgi:pyridoxal phosphate enzyme (YggS family)
MTLDTVEARLQHVRDRIASAAAAAGRSAADITLVAVSKTHPASDVEAAIAAGQLCFGENRVQEADAKFPALKQVNPAVALHLIGPLQTNKLKDALRVADVIETLDRPRLADALAAALARGERLPQLLIQINVGEEPQKAGIAPGDADRFVADCQERFGARVAGLMCIPPAGVDPSPFFAELAERAARYRLPIVSMGMSADYEVAIRHGATHVRVGSAIFGNRPAP